MFYQKKVFNVLVFFFKNSFFEIYAHSCIYHSYIFSAINEIFEKADISGNGKISLQVKRKRRIKGDKRDKGYKMIVDKGDKNYKGNKGDKGDKNYEEM